MLNSSSRLVVETQCVLTPFLHPGDSPLIPDKDDFSCQRESPFSSSAHPKSQAVQRGEIALRRILEGDTLAACQSGSSWS